MLTIFTIPKPFLGHIGIIQKNAINSWLKIAPKSEIILFGNDDGVSEIAQELNVKHISYIEQNEFGAPLLSSAFNAAQKMAKNKILMYTNTDVIFAQDLIESIRLLEAPSFLLCGRRWDLDVKEEIDFQNHEWLNKLLERVKNEGRLHGMSGMDYFIFPKIWWK